jgi:hypothetical protein
VCCDICINEFQKQHVSVHAKAPNAALLLLQQQQQLLLLLLFTLA